MPIAFKVYNCVFLQCYVLSIEMSQLPAGKVIKQPYSNSACRYAQVDHVYARIQSEFMNIEESI